MPGIDSPSKLIVQCNGAGNSFLDSEPGTPKTINVNGSATQYSIKFNNTAGFFDGTSDGNSVRVPDSTDWNFGTGNYTIETFFCPSGSGGSNIIIQDITDSTNIASLDYVGGVIRYGVYVANVAQYAILQHTVALTAGTFYHIAIVRNGTDQRMYLDGVSVSSTTASFTYPNYTQGLFIGYNDINSGFGLKGWLKELRISNTARYTSGFTPPTTQFTSDSSTKLLLHFDNPSQQSYGPLNAAIKLDGTGDYLSLADSADWDFGTGAFTLEGFCRFNSVGTASIVECGDGAGAAGTRLVYSGGNWYLSINNTAAVVSSSFTPIANKWYHMAGVRSGSNCYIFADGVLIGTGTNSASISGSTNGARVGSDTTNQHFNGWLKEVRVSNVARYIVDFTPSQTGFTVDANTKLYVKGDEANGSTTFVDSETSPKTITTNGDAKIDYQEDYRSSIFKDDGNTGHKPYSPVGSRAKVDFLAPFGSGVGTFAGSGGVGTDPNLTIADSSDWDFGTGDYCLETYFRMSSVSGSRVFFDRNKATTSWSFDYNGGSFRQQLNNGVRLSASFTPIVDVWYHLAFVRSAGVLSTYINGTSIGSGAYATAIADDTSGIGIAADTSFDYGLSGYLDNARISNVARYTAAFNPPLEFTNALGFMSFFLDM